MNPPVPRVVLVVALVALPGGCSPSSDPGSAPEKQGRLILDGLDRPVVVPVPARRIVSLAPSNTEILFALGAGSSLVGRDNQSDYPPEALEVPGLGTTAGQLNRELMLTLRPDLVLAAQINSPEKVGSLSKLGLTVFMIKNPKTFEELHKNILLVGTLTARENRARELVSELRARVRVVETRLQKLVHRPRVYYELDATDPTRPWTVGPGTFLDMLITLAGGENLGADHSHSFPRISAEEVILEDPEVIVLGDASSGVTVDEVGQRSGWSELSAIKNGKVYVLDDDLASRPGPRLVEALEVLARLLHPDRFED